MSSPTGDGNPRRRGSGDVPHWSEDSDGSEIGKLGGFGGDFGKSACSESWAGWRRRLSVRCGISERFRRRWKLPERLAAVLTRGNRPMRRTERNRDDPVILWNYIFFWYRLCGWGNRIKKNRKKGFFMLKKNFNFSMVLFTDDVTVWQGRNVAAMRPENRCYMVGREWLARPGLSQPDADIPQSAVLRHPARESSRKVTIPEQEPGRAKFLNGAYSHCFSRR